MTTPATIPAAIEAAARALFDTIRLDTEPPWDQAGAKTRQQCCELADAAVRAAQPILRQAFVEEAAQTIEAARRGRSGDVVGALIEAEQIVREIGGIA